MSAPHIAKSISFINRCSAGHLDRELRGLDLGSGTYPVLLCLHSLDEISQSRLSEELAVDKAWIARAVRRLLDLGYIQKRSDPADSRACLLTLSAAGRDLVPRIKAVIARWNETLGAGLGEEELACVERGLRKILENAQRNRSGSEQGETER